MYSTFSLAVLLAMKLKSGGSSVKGEGFSPFSSPRPIPSGVPPTTTSTGCTFTIASSVNKVFLHDRPVAPKRLSAAPRPHFDEPRPGAIEINTAFGEFGLLNANQLKCKEALERTDLNQIGPSGLQGNRGHGTLPLAKPDQIMTHCYELMVGRVKLRTRSR
jgi:hypothetical protein